jgi:hypothetical protein
VCVYIHREREIEYICMDARVFVGVGVLSLSLTHSACLSVSRLPSLSLSRSISLSLALSLSLSRARALSLSRSPILYITAQASVDVDGQALPEIQESQPPSILTMCLSVYVVMRESTLENLWRNKYNK